MPSTFGNEDRFLLFAAKGSRFAMNARHRDPKPPNGHASRRLTVRPDHPIPPRPGRVTPNLPRHHQLVPPDPKPSNILRVPAIATTLPAAPDRTSQTRRCFDAMTSPARPSHNHDPPNRPRQDQSDPPLPRRYDLAADQLKHTPDWE